jgi:hypothetical protein
LLVVVAKKLTYTYKNMLEASGRKERERTEVLVGFILISVFHEGCDLLSLVEDACMSNGSSQTVQLGEHAFTTFKVLKAKAFDVRSEELELAKAVVGMAVEASNERFV